MPLRMVVSRALLAWSDATTPRSHKITAYHFNRRADQTGHPGSGNRLRAIASAKRGLLLPEAAQKAGPGLRAVCEALKIPPVLHMGSCVDISRILVVAAAVANALEVDISDLPPGRWLPRNGCLKRRSVLALMLLAQGSTRSWEQYRRCWAARRLLPS